MSPHPYLSMECVVSFTSPHRKQSENRTRNCFHLAFSSLTETSLCYPLFTAFVFFLVCFSHFLLCGISKVFISFLQHPLSSCCLCFSISCATFCPSLPPLTTVCPSHCCSCCLGFSIPPCPPLYPSTSLTSVWHSHCCFYGFASMVLLSSSPCLSHPLPPMFPSGDPLSIHHYFHGYLAGFTVRPGSLESREVIECLYACREGLDYSDFDSLGKGMKVCPSAQFAWVSSTLLPQPCFPRLCLLPPPQTTLHLSSYVSLSALIPIICQGTMSLFFHL